MYFDGASNYKGYGVGNLVVSLQGLYIPISTKLDFKVINNTDEYEACIIRMQATQALQIKTPNVHGDLRLIINQITGSWKRKSKSLDLYQAHSEKITSNFKDLRLTYLSRKESQFVDTVAN